MTTKGSGVSTASSKTLVTIADKYVVEKEIGKGSFAVVYKGHLLTNNEENVAIKAVSRSKLKNKKLLENLEIEIAILKKIKHPHIVDLLECERALTDFYLIMEYCALGDLTFFIKKRKSLVEKHPLIRTVFEKYPPPSDQHNGLNRVLVINYLQQLSSALRFLRSKNLVHRDIKPQNLLLSTPLLDYSDPKTFHDRGFVGIYNLPILKIADFGFARFLPNTSLAETLCGSPLYMAPEILNYQKYNAKADLWSVGTVLYEMCCGRPPFKASNHLELFQKIKKANDVINFPKHVDLEPHMIELICGLLTFEPTKRMDFTEFFSNELVNENLSQYEEDSEPDLESKSRDVAESNMFVLEYLTANDRIKRSPSVHLPNLAISVDPIRPVQQTPAGVKQISNKEIRPLYADKHAVSAPSTIETRNSKMSEKLKNSYSDLLLEKEYVVVEKKSVEVNALADEFAHAGSGLQAIRLPDQQFHDLPQPSYANQHSLGSAGLLSGNPKQTFMRRNSRTLSSSGGSTSRRPSLVDRRMSITSLGAANALSKALGMASQRLFGNNQQQSTNTAAAVKQNSSTSPLQTAQAFHDMTENLVLGADHQWDNSRQADVIHDDVIVRALENLTAKSFVIYSFAEVKFSQIIPLPSTSPHDHFPNKRLSNGSCAIDDEDEEIDPTAVVETVKKGTPNGNINTGNVFPFSLDTIHELSLNDLPPRELHHLCTESIVLYMKSLSLLAYAMQLTSKWWHESADKTCPLKLNVLVQWIREKFNECLEKAEFLRTKLQSLQMNFTEQQLSLSETEDCEPIFVEKLIYDRALDISKGAAKMEIQGEYLESCEVAYSTSLWMLESLLDVINDDDNYDDDNLGHTSVLDSADREMIKKYIDSIANRLKALRKKIGR